MVRPITLLILLLIAAAGSVEAQLSGITQDSLAVWSSIRGYNPTPGKTYNRLLIPKKATQDTNDVVISALPEDVQITTEYFDYAGRKIQTVLKQASPLKKDVVSVVQYDFYGNVSNNYLPYVQSGSNSESGTYKSWALLEDSSFYKQNFPNENAFFGKTVFDGSPIETAIKVTSVGNSWAGTGVGKVLSTRSSSITDSVRLWEIEINSEDDLPVTDMLYAPGSLLVTEMVDEDGRRKIRYQDEGGRLVLSKVLSDSSAGSGHGGWLCTYYVYDEASQLRIVIPPKAVDALLRLNWDLGSNPEIASGLCYSYFYDARGRVIMRQVPGKGKCYAVFDRFDRTVLMQDAVQRLSSQWTFIKYDAQGRPRQTGVIEISSIVDSLRVNASSSSDFPTLNGEFSITTETFYDNYDWADSLPLLKGLLTSHINSHNFISSTNSFPEYAEPISEGKRTRGYTTGNKRQIVGTSQYLYTLTIFDDKGRSVQVKETNITGGTDIITTQYSYSGAILRAHIQTQKQGINSQAHTVLTKFIFDHGGRLISVYKNVDSTGNKKTKENIYNEISRLVSTKLAPESNGGGGLETLNYDYSIRGWLLGVNKEYVKGNTNHWFGYGLGYEGDSTGVTGSTYLQTQLAGNITGTVWRSYGDGEIRKFDYTYDLVNRLSSAKFSQYTNGTFNTTAGLDFSVSRIEYDLAGNITTLKQKGAFANGSALIDNMTYTYLNNSNQLKQVFDSVNNNATVLGDFHYDDATKLTTDYSYNGNGSLVSDKNKGISSISYNYLNLPSVISIAGKGRIEYTYDPLGVKLKKSVIDSTTSPISSQVTLYIAGCTYQNDTLQFIGHDEGRIRFKPIGGTFVYDYMIKDYLGNVRVVLTDDSLITQYQTLSFEDTSQVSQDAQWENRYGSSIDVQNCRTRVNFGGSQTNALLVRKSLGAIGATKLLKVMAGDKIHTKVSYFYSTENSDNSEATPLDFLLPSLVSSLSTSSATTKLLQGEGESIGELLSSNTDLSTFIDIMPNTNPSDASQEAPKAYLCVLFFNEQFKFDKDHSYIEKVAYLSNGEAATIDKTFSNAISVPKNGYAFVYFANESNELVYFDNFQLSHERGPLLEETHYYPFGGTMVAISSQAAEYGRPINRLNFNGKESQTNEFRDGTNLDWIDYGARMYDPQIGRWHVIDPLSETSRRWAPYNFAFDNPVMFIDPDGMRALRIEQFDSPLNFGNLGESLETNSSFLDEISAMSAAVTEFMDQSARNEAAWDNLLGKAWDKMVSGSGGGEVERRGALLHYDGACDCITVTSNIYVYSQILSIAEVTAWATTIETAINSMWGTEEAYGTIGSSKQNGRVREYKLHFQVKVHPVTYAGAVRALNKLDQSMAFYSLDGMAGSHTQQDGDDAPSEFDLSNFATTENTVAAHEYGHVLGYFNRGGIAGNTHASRDEELYIMGPNYPNRYVHLEEYRRVNLYRLNDQDKIEPGRGGFRMNTNADQYIGVEKSFVPSLVPKRQFAF